MDDDTVATANSHKISLPNGASIVKLGFVERRSYRRIIPTWLSYTAVIDENNNLYLFSGTRCEYKVFIVDIHVQYLTPNEAFGRKFAFAINNFSSSSYASFRKKYCSCFSRSSKNRKYSKKMMILTTNSEAETSDWVDVISTILRKGQSSQASHAYESFDSLNVAQSLPPINPKKLKQVKLQELRAKRENQDDCDDENDIDLDFLEQLSSSMNDDSSIHSTTSSMHGTIADSSVGSASTKTNNTTSDKLIPQTTTMNPSYQPNPIVAESFHENEFLGEGGVALVSVTDNNRQSFMNNSGHINPMIILAAASMETEKI